MCGCRRNVSGGTPDTARGTRDLPAPPPAAHYCRTHVPHDSSLVPVQGAALESCTRLRFAPAVFHPLHGVAHEFGAIGEAEFFFDVGAMGFDGAGADAHLRGDVLGGAA